MNPRAVPTALYAVGNVAGMRRPTGAWLQDDFKGLSPLAALGSDRQLSQHRAGRPRYFTGSGSCFCFVIVDTPTPSSSSGPTFFSAIVRSSYLIFPSKSQLPA